MSINGKEVRFIKVSSNGQDEFKEVYESLDEANQSAYEDWQYLTQEEKCSHQIRVDAVSEDKLKEELGAFDEKGTVIDWTAYNEPIEFPKEYLLNSNNVDQLISFISYDHITGKQTKRQLRMNHVGYEYYEPTVYEKLKDIALKEAPSVDFPYGTQYFVAMDGTDIQTYAKAFSTSEKKLLTTFSNVEFEQYKLIQPKKYTANHIKSTITKAKSNTLEQTR